MGGVGFIWISIEYKRTDNISIEKKVEVKVWAALKMLIHKEDMCTHPPMQIQCMKILHQFQLSPLLC